MARQKVNCDQDYQNLIQHIKGVRDIVINTCHGGFGLSKQAQKNWLERNQIPYTQEPREARYDNERWGPYILVNGLHWNDRDIARDDPILVAIVKEMGKDSWGDHARLKVVRIPADVEWEIQEYDGNEWVAEKHRTWC